MAVIAIDLDATGCKAALLEGERMLAPTHRHFNYSSPEDGWAAQDAEAVWHLVDCTVREALAGCDSAPDVAAIGVSVQGDASGNTPTMKISC